MKHIILGTACSLFSLSLGAQIYTAKQGETLISFFSEAPLENIEATNKSAAIVLKTTTSDLQVSLSPSNFKFKNALMEEHFNENYMETTKFPKVVFKGRITELVDYSKAGETAVTVSGKLEMHGVTRDVTMNGTINNTGTELKLQSKFRIRVADYNIKVPSMYVKNIAEEVEVTFKTTLEPFKKP